MSIRRRRGYQKTQGRLAGKTASFLEHTVTSSKNLQYSIIFSSCLFCFAMENQTLLMLPNTLLMSYRSSSEPGRACAKQMVCPSQRHNRCAVSPGDVRRAMVSAEQSRVWWVHHAGSVKLARPMEHSAVSVAKLAGLGQRDHEMQHKNASSKFAISKLHELDCISSFCSMPAP